MKKLLFPLILLISSALSACEGSPAIPQDSIPQDSVVCERDSALFFFDDLSE